MEMSKVKVARKHVDGVTMYQAGTGLVKDLIGNQEINCHVIFDVRMEFQLKARFLDRGHMTEAPNIITYSRIVSRDSICTGFL